MQNIIFYCLKNLKIPKVPSSLSLCDPPAGRQAPLQPGQPLGQRQGKGHRPRVSQGQVKVISRLFIFNF